MSSLPICTTCGTQYASMPDLASCRVCEDERQYVGWDGQHWTSSDELARTHRVAFERESGVLTMRIVPEFAIGQRAFLVPHGKRHVMWETLSLVTAEAVATIEALGGVSLIAISHPHFYAAMVEWSDALGGVPIYVHEADRQWVERMSGHVRFWSGDRLALCGDLELVHLPGHFPGSAGLWWKSGPTSGGSLFPGDALQVAMDRRHVSFMYSYPNMIPLGPGAVNALRRTVASLRYADVFGFAAGRQILGGGEAAVDRSFDRYLAATADRTLVAR